MSYRGLYIGGVLIAYVLEPNEYAKLPARRRRFRGLPIIINLNLAGNVAVIR